MQTIQQQRAKAALDAIKAALGAKTIEQARDAINKALADNPNGAGKQNGQAAPAEQGKKVDPARLKAYANALPAMIHMNGLGQAAAFCATNKKGEYGVLYTMLSAWLRRKNPQQPYAGKADLLQGITDGDMDAYLAAQAEALAFAGWVKTFANARIDDPADKPAGASPDDAGEGRHA